MRKAFSIKVHQRSTLAVLPPLLAAISCQFLIRQQFAAKKIAKHCMIYIIEQ